MSYGRHFNKRATFPSFTAILPLRQASELRDPKIRKEGSGDLPCAVSWLFNLRLSRTVILSCGRSGRSYF